MTRFTFSHATIAFAATAALIVSGLPAEAREGRVRARGENGVASAGSHNGNSYVRARGKTTAEDGSTTAASGGAVRLNNGASVARRSSTTLSPDGSASHQGGFAASGAKGTVDSSGSAVRNADGTGSGSRSTNVTSASGNIYQRTTTYDSATGVTRQANCRDASGVEITCPTR